MDNMDNNTPAPEEKKTLSDREVTAHTASLWKYNPVPDSPEPYPEYKNSDDTIGSARIAAARVRGKKHKHDGTNCDDWYEFDRVGDWVIAAVSDGAGSKPLSRIGARVSCETVISTLKTEFSAVAEMCPDIKEQLSKPFSDGEFNSVCSKLAVIMQNSFSAAFSAVENAYIARSNKPEYEESMGRKPEISDYSGTLLAAVMIPVCNNEHFIISIQVGDGMIASVNAEADFGSALRILGNADSGAFAGETEFLTSAQAVSADSLRSRTKIQRGKISALLLMTDGVADDYYPNNPQLLRLYLDLALNGIVDIPSGDAGAEYTPSEPVAYPWVNDSDVSYSLQYAKNIMSKNDIALDLLWQRRGENIVQKSTLSAYDITNGAAPSGRLSVWLDNYVERGSFDDRTLLAVIVNNGEKL